MDDLYSVPSMEDDLVSNARLVSQRVTIDALESTEPWHVHESRFTLLSLSCAMSPFSRLRSALISTLTPQGFQSVEQELFDQLVSNRQHILDLYNVGPQNLQQRLELESGQSLARPPCKHS